MSPGGWTNFSITSANHAADDEGPVAVSEDVPACASCKKRKLRCSRETPSCLHCLRLSIDCVYAPRQKPGLKPGALEALTRRVALLEQILLDDTGNVRPQYNPNDPPLPIEEGGAFSATDGDDVATNMNDHEQDEHPIAPPPGYQQHDHGSGTNDHPVDQDPVANLRKRKCGSSFSTAQLFQLEDIDIAEHLPSQPILLKLVDYFCISFHHWIPYLHKQRLQTFVSKGTRNSNMDLVLHALVAVGLRHMDRESLYLDEDQIQQQSRTSRAIVEKFAMMAVSIESLQALIFIVFDYLNGGQIQKAWPLIGSLTRTVDYLQLTTEPSASQFGALMNPLRLVQPSNDWTELEERRRLFWVIFLLDRFCSVSTGWNTSLTSEDVHRRLPADGGYFTREEPVTTPYFGIWNKAAARIGRSLANVPAQYNEDDPAVEQPQGPGASPNSANGFIDASKLGAFAYCVEATESLSQVTTFFLQQRINWQDKEHAVSWLTRFKELDLRLVHWKLFLPPRWKDSNISEDTGVVNMDPNLTLAHITHNTSMILLHHSIAYPARGWNDYVALPKECSAQTCELAAVETSNIVGKFLSHTSIPFVNVQFAFCAFVAAKALLFEHQATKKPIRPEFQQLIANLWDMSARWKGEIVKPGQNPQNGLHTNQPGMYAHHLEYLREVCQQDAKFRFDLYDHSCQKPAPNQHVSPAYVATPHRRSDSFAQDRRRPSFKERHNSLHSSNSPISPRRLPSNNLSTDMNIDFRNQPPKAPMQSPGLPPTFTPQNGPTAFPVPQQNAFNASIVRAGPPNQQYQAIAGTPNNHQTLHDQSLMNLSDTFMDSHFLDMDRVITFEEANFFLPGDAYRWQ